MPRIFISYRRADSADAAGRIYDNLVARFGDESVFRDIEDIEKGEDFVQVLQNEVASCEVMLVVIGQAWLAIQDSAGQRRLDDPHDFVRIEVETALSLSHVRVIPVLVNGAVMPAADDLSTALRDLHRRNAATVRGEPDFGRDIRALMDDVDAAFVSKGRLPFRVSPVALSVAALVMAVLVLLVLAGPQLASIISGTADSTPVPPPTVPSLAAYEVGLAVAYFQAGPGVDADKADQLVDQVFLRLETELSSFTDQVGFTLGLLAPQVIGRIQGDTLAEREAQARELAQQVGADIVVYGSVVADGQNLVVQPEFYVFPDDFREALDITGSYRLGRAITVTGPLSDISNVIRVNQPLGARTEAMAKILAGLVYYGAEDYESALGAFEQALENQNWGDAEGREILYILLGNTRLKLAARDLARGDLDTDVSMNLAEAQRLYERAVELAPNFSRAYGGLAAYHYVTWNQVLQASGLSLEDSLQRALDNLDKAEAVPDKPLDVGIRTRTLLSRVSVNYALYRHHQDGLLDEERADLRRQIERDADQIIRNYDNGRQPAVGELAVEAYAFLGLVARAEDNCADGIEHFNNAIDLSNKPHRQMFYQGWLGDCYQQTGDVTAARQAYQTALDIAEQLDDELATQDYQSSLADLDAQGE